MTNIFWIVKNIISGRSFKVKVNSKRNIPKIVKIILKKNNFVVLKLENNSFYARDFFTCFKNSFFEQVK